MSDYTLENAHENAKKWPDTFHLPDKEDIESLGTGGYVKLCFLPTDGAMGERMWVKVKLRSGDTFRGALANDPANLTLGRLDDPVAFREENIFEAVSLSEMKERLLCRALGALKV
jgi:uncharacterized protein YegJ (DUF2314 family)